MRDRGEASERTVRLDAASVEAIARRMAELFCERARPISRPLVDALTVARALGVQRETVYNHQNLLGVRRGPGKRGRLRFDLDEAVEAWASREDNRGSATDESGSTPRGRRRRKHKSGPGDAQLLPIRGRESR